MTSSSDDLDTMWQRQATWWNVLFAAVTGTTALSIVLSTPHRLIALVPLAVLVVAYVAWGCRVFGPGFGSWRGRAYLGIGWAAYLLIMWLTADAGTPWLLSFVIFPHTWAMVRTRAALWITIVGALGLGLIEWLTSDHSSSAATVALVTTLIMLVLSVALGLFINRIIAEAETRATIIDTLHQTQERLAAAERDRGVQAERERLAREIHDTLAQGFTSVLALARAADSALSRGEVSLARDRLALVQSTAADNLAEARIIVAGTTPGHLESRSLVEALDRLAVATRGESALRVDFDVRGTPVPLGGAADVVLLRAAQESLTNVRRHAAASRVHLQLCFEDTQAVLETRDDGRGFDPKAPAGGFGLDGIRSRVAEIGGHTDVASTPGAGTRVRVSVPR